MLSCVQTCLSVCGIEISQIDNYYDVFEDGGGKIFKCHLCPKAMPNKVRIRRHVAGVHLSKFTRKGIDPSDVEKYALISDPLQSGLPKYMCKICNKSVCNRRNLINHIEIKHCTASPQKCDFCEKVLSNKHSAMNHMRFCRKKFDEVQNVM